MSNKEKLVAVLQEIAKRKLPQTIIDDLFDEQRAVAKHPSRNKSILTSRRAGKSYSICSIMASKCVETPDTRCLYLALTRTNVKRIAWQILIILNNKYNLNCVFNKTSLIVEFPNGSTIELAGADSHIDLTERFLGAFYDVVAIDEAGSYNPVILDHLIDVVLDPCLVDRRGTLILAGTPRPIDSGRFYTSTTAPEAPWEVFRWNTYSNPYIKEQWEEKIQELKTANPEIECESWFIREYLGEWARDKSTSVYRFDANNNLVASAPEGTFTYVLGLDIGWDDDCSFVVAGWRKNDATLYVFESYKKPGMLPDAIANQLKHYMNIYQPITIVGDTSSKTVIKEIGHRYGVDVVPAERTNKADWIETINSEFTLKKIQIVQKTNIELLKEIKELPWMDKPNGTRIEHPAYANHLTDGLLYAFRWAWHYLEKPKVVLTEEDKIWKQQVAMANKRKNAPRWHKRYAR